MVDPHYREFMEARGFRVMQDPSDEPRKPDPQVPPESEVPTPVLAKAKTARVKKAPTVQGDVRG